VVSWYEGGLLMVQVVDCCINDHSIMAGLRLLSVGMIMNCFLALCRDERMSSCCLLRFEHGVGLFFASREQTFFRKARSSSSRV
jgi:hypothetical protein